MFWGELIWLNIVIYYNHWKAKLILIIAVGPVQGKFLMLTISTHWNLRRQINFIDWCNTFNRFARKGILALLNCVVVDWVYEKQIYLTQYKTDWNHLGRINFIRCCNLLKSSRQFPLIKFYNNMKTVMVNNTTNINKMNNPLSS